MTFLLIIREEAESDLLQTETWYEDQNPGLGREFLKSVRECLDNVAKNPLIYSIRYKRRQVRFAYVRKFPYRIIFRTIKDKVFVYAVLHSSRHDRNWKDRI